MAMNLKQLLESTPRLRAWSETGQVQYTELQQFAEEVLNSQVSAVTYDGVGVKPGEQVWVLSSLRTPVPTTVKVLQAYTNYILHNNLTPVSQSFSTREAANNYLKHNR
jgi:hypothetical protein